MTVIAKLQVREEHGIRRFLYPLTVNLPLKISNKEIIAVVDSSGILLPCEHFCIRNRTILTFAVSLGPFERKRLNIVHGEHLAQIPDPITCDYLPDGRILNRQERVHTTLSSALDLNSVVYDSVEHLSSPVHFELNGLPANDEKFSARSLDGALSFTGVTKRVYEEGCTATTNVHLTACKSWVAVDQELTGATVGSALSLIVPLSPGTSSEIPTCDFGLGNGAYSKIDGDAVMFEAIFFAKNSNCFWQISRESEGVQRIDYQGQIGRPKLLAESLWFHWNLPTRAIAVAITAIPKGCSQLNIRLCRDGLIEIHSVLGDHTPRKVTLGACLHFLNASPALAAATNPASILCMPTVTVKV